MYSKRPNRERFASQGEVVDIGQSLSVTPSQIALMAEKGIPINSSNIDSQFYDGSPDVTFSDFGATDVRGVDISDIWVSMQDSRNHVKKLSKLQEKAKSLEKSTLLQSSNSVS